MQINIATGNAVIHAVQDREQEKVTADTRKEQLKRRIQLLRKNLVKYGDNETTKRGFEQHIAELEEELSQLEAGN